MEEWQGELIGFQDVCVNVNVCKKGNTSDLKLTTDTSRSSISILIHILRASYGFLSIPHHLIIILRNRKEKKRQQTLVI